MTDTPSLASQLEELAAKATQGEWTHNNDFAEAEYISTPDAEIFMHAEWPWEYKEEASANVALVLALRNNVPAIIAGLRAEAEATELREENARLREVLEPFAKHADCHDRPDITDADSIGGTDGEITFGHLRAASAALGENRDD